MLSLSRVVIIVGLIAVGSIGTETEAQPTTPVQLFQGYDSVVGDARSPAVTGTSSTVGASSTVEYSVCQDSNAIRKSLELDQSASVSFGPFGGGDEKSNFYRSLDLTSFSVSIVVHAKHVEGQTNEITTHFVPDISTTPGLFGNKEKFLSQFANSYGDSYVKQITTGGEYFAVYTFYARDATERSQLVASMNAHGIVGGIGLSASLQANISNFARSTHAESSLKEAVSGIKNPPVLPDGDGVIAFALKFSSLPLTAPAVIDFKTASYDTVASGQNLKPIADARRMLSGDDENDDLSTQLVKLTGLKSQIERIFGIYKFYGGFSDPNLTNDLSEVAGDIATAHSLIRQYEANPIAKLQVPQFKILRKGSPSVNFIVGSSPSWGGGGGGPFDDVDISIAVSEMVRPAALQLGTYDYVYALYSWYDTDHGQVSKAEGGSAGSLTNKLEILPGQSIAKVWGAFTKYLTGLTIILSDGRSIGGGCCGGTPFSWTPPPNSFVIGFSGRAGAAIDQLRVDYMTLQPAVWR